MVDHQSGIRFDYFAVLGYRLNHDGTVADTFGLRLVTAIAKMRSIGYKGPIIISGGRPREDVAPSEAKVGAEYLIASGIDAARIIEEPFSKDTFGNIALMGSMLSHKRRIPIINIVTSSTHIERVGIVADWLLNSGEHRIAKIALTPAPNPPRTIIDELRYELQEFGLLMQALRAIPDGKDRLIRRVETAVRNIDLALTAKDADKTRALVEGRVAKLVNERNVSLLRSESRGRSRSAG